MEVYKIVAEKVCDLICNNNYHVVVNQAKMSKNNYSFEFNTIYKKTIKVQLDDGIDNNIVVYNKLTNTGSVFHWTNDWTIEEIADEIIKIALKN